VSTRAPGKDWRNVVLDSNQMIQYPKVKKENTYHNKILKSLATAFNNINDTTVHFSSTSLSFNNKVLHLTIVFLFNSEVNTDNYYNT